MATKKSRRARTEYRKQHIRELTDQLNQPNSDEIHPFTKYKLVTFSSSAETKTDNWVDGKKLKKKAGELSADGGTNYDQGLSQAATAINSSSRENYFPDRWKTDLLRNKPIWIWK